MSLAEFGAKMSREFEQLSPQNQKGAAYMMRFPEDVALLSMRDVAKKAGVHASTLVRLAQALGHSSYVDIKKQFAESLKEGRLSSFSARARELQVRNDTSRADSHYPTIVHEHEAILGEILCRNGLDRIDSFARQLLAVEKLFMFGVRSAFAPMYQYFYLYQMFRQNGILVNDPGGAQSDLLGKLRAADGLLLVSFNPYARASVHAARLAQELGASVYLISDSLVSPVAAHATAILTVPTSISSFFPSLVGVNALLEVVVARQVVFCGSTAIEELSSTEKRLLKLGAYWNEREEK
ncbi:MurR/RpiR family transcriptional regulator [Agrobacterium sp. CNPSo 2736]|uniref:MurR/RpiR family transcriptional regulator n=1 Tax=Agrobacterium sp. CNPSo 2736 TaxID=2499627 RepID=UPI000FD908B5|nr:MurR/RpiR family transcriptional regulator [Agrobacterium sp. CNPSo 2736]RVT69680.1 MurR/RpiR family transcriptional regulator [Agrobacterium sp. CNPSo 2736]